PSAPGSQHAPERREALRVEEARGRGVGRDHDVFDQVLRAAPSFGDEIDEVAVLEDGARLERLQGERAALEAPAPQRLRDAVLQLELLVDAWDLGHALRR